MNSVTKSQMHEDAKHAASFSLGDTDVVLSGSPWREGNMLVCWVFLATVGGKAVKLDNPYQFVNPPLMVPDGTVKIKKIHGRDVEVSNMKEDHEAAFRSILTDVLRQQAR